MDLLSRKVFFELAQRGFFALCSGGPDVGARVLHNPKVTSWMMTGGCATFDAIVWGGAKGKQEQKRVLDKECHAELGAASPYIIVPGVWTEGELKMQAQMLAAYKLVNAGHICASPQIVIVDRQWVCGGITRAAFICCPLLLI